MSDASKSNNTFSERSSQNSAHRRRQATLSDAGHGASVISHIQC